MDELVYSYTNSLISKEELEETLSKLQDENQKMRKADYNDERASLHLLDDIEMIERVKTLIEEKKKLNPRYLVVIGIGGSNLGTIAVQEAILGKLYNLLENDIKILYADTVDSDNISNILAILKLVLERGENILINIISKSGRTTETIANSEVILDLLKKYKEDYNQYIVTTTQRDSKLWRISEEYKLNTLEIPKMVGGRYSIFSPVGLFPLGILGIDIDRLVEGARRMRERCLDSIENPASINASLVYLHNERNRNIHDLFLFNSDLEGVGKWYRQLLAESIGKELDRDGRQVFSGITPTVSIGSTDLHSMAQLYLAGPYDKFTTFVSTMKPNNSIDIPVFNGFNRLVYGIQGGGLEDVMKAILEGVKKAFEKKLRPYSEIILPDKREYSIGQLLQMEMLEVMYLGALLNVNPFDQPNVEDYKIETRKILEATMRR
ncbi:MAG: hypothetical protein DRN12_04880 [Thermoplasmata archaeon]|nr:MAG: hypothetical protein DRN12_04880 [Thermoplasmata archaeon]